MRKYDYSGGIVIYIHFGPYISLFSIPIQCLLNFFFVGGGGGGGGGGKGGVLWDLRK